MVKQRNCAAPATLVASPEAVGSQVLQPVTVVTTVLNDKANLEKCLESILQQDYPKEFYKIIIVDAGSTDGTIDLIREYQVRQKNLQIELVQQKGCNRSQGRNLGLQKSKTNLIAIVDSDAVLSKNWLSVVVEEIEAHPKCAGIASYHVKPHNQGLLGRAMWYMPHLVHTNEFAVPEIKYKDTCEVRNVPDVAALYRKDALKEVGFYDERLNWGEDYEMDIRLLKAGWKLILAKKARSEHRYKTKLSKFFRQQFGYGYGLVPLERYTPAQVNEIVPRNVRLLLRIAPIAFVLSGVFCYWVPSMVTITVAFFIVMFLVFTLPHAINAFKAEKNLQFFFAVLFLYFVKYLANFIGFWKEELSGFRYHSKI